MIKIGPFHVFHCFFLFSSVGFSEFSKISVVVPVYNSHLWVSVCLKSLLNQSFENLEIICVNDGSTDRSLQILREFARENVRVKVIHQNNCGVSCARNNGLKIAMGEYVTFVDSDDWLELNAYEIAYEEAKQNEIDVVVWGFINERNKVYGGPSLKKIYRGKDSALFLFPIRSFRSSCVWNKMYLRSILTDNSITFMETKYGEDFLFNLDIIPFVNSVQLINRTLYHYKPSSSGLFSVHSFKDQKILADSIFSHWKNLKNHIRFNQVITNDHKIEINHLIRKLRRRFNKKKRHKKTKK